MHTPSTRSCCRTCLVVIYPWYAYYDFMIWNTHVHHVLLSKVNYIMILESRVISMHTLASSTFHVMTLAQARLEACVRPLISVRPLYDFPSVVPNTDAIDSIRSGKIFKKIYYESKIYFSYWCAGISLKVHHYIKQQCLFIDVIILGDLIEF